MNRPASPSNLAPNAFYGEENDSSMFYMSPTCVMEHNSFHPHHQDQDQLQQQPPAGRKSWNGLPEVPEILGNSASSGCDVWEDQDHIEERRVRFSLPTPNDSTMSLPLEGDDEPQEEEAPTTSSSSSWYSRSEIASFHQDAKARIQSFRKENQDWIEQFCHDLSLDPNHRPPALQQLLKMHRPTSDFDSVRGLQLSPLFIQHRRLHAQRILMIQQKCPSEQPQESREAILRSTSVQTSRSSRTLARWLAHYDHVDMVRMIRQELHAQQPQGSY
mmetsp:Transcript_135654/g.201746  ORF Transcript_135654/g.201746 Transcript_135654/m.201746 type:complete len:273 (+) Transcript_135654:62-880(+)|eukprot:CAMPEP_0117039396 /NCGR_PEP_ID=MMETSP0472-20121206/27655_1 /TAXON_ID=693140 ORGANISM="Tiarina fusus, Strain LIS" /NCGR_SAMPLE_ID=MMETSP0472 /ASSEMBLY_ACC=CAM_ASM_000603 /LENGTH=272 /DNA_ID=CAMNT_0004749881 /DNA_START=50 /DNA_END=868 /DNA_ORIENTATION=+